MLQLRGLVERQDPELSEDSGLRGPTNVTREEQGRLELLCGGGGRGETERGSLIYLEACQYQCQ